MADLAEKLKYKLRRVRELGTPRYFRWLCLQRFYPNTPLATQLCDDITIRYSPRGNVSRDIYIGQFEHDVVSFLKQYVCPGMVVMDLGANVGVYTLLCAKFVGEKGQVHSFEPTPFTFQQLQNNVHLNRFSWVHLNELAVSATAGQCSFFVYEQCGMNSMNKQAWVGKPLRQIMVNTISLDEYVEARNMTRIDLIKMDVEGAELQVLKGGKNLLSGPNAPVLICEFTDKTTSNFGYQTSVLRENLEAFGYKLFRWSSTKRQLINEPLRRDYEIYANLVCVKNS